MKAEKIRIAILHPFIAHYRAEFFQFLNQKIGTDIYVYEDVSHARADFFQVSDMPVKKIKAFQVKGLLFYNPFPLLKKEYGTIVLMLHFAHVTSWFLLMTQFIHRKRIILFGQGISVRRYLQEEKKPDWKLKWMLALCDVAWLYMEKEKEQWQKIFPGKKIVALKNSISGVSNILSYKSGLSKEDLKYKYNILQPVVLIFCARFTNKYRRVDLLESVIQSLDSEKFGFIIIGDGVYKPDFVRYNNVYDFGSVYDFQLKSELFYVADIYFQPAWVGLSIVEAMAYGKPILTFRRAEDRLQCVEYSYITDGWNGKIVDDLSKCIAFINESEREELEQMGRHAQDYVSKELTPELMVERIISSL